MKKTISIIAILSLTGCATWEQLDEGLDKLVGRPLDVAISKLGYPATEQTIAGRKLYRWGNSSQGVAYMPSTSTTYATLGVGARAVPYAATTDSGSYIPVNYACNLTLATNNAGIVISYQYEGNMGGCKRYINALKK